MEASIARWLLNTASPFVWSRRRAYDVRSSAGGAESWNLRADQSINALITRSDRMAVRSML